MVRCVFGSRIAQNAIFFHNYFSFSHLVRRFRLCFRHIHKRWNAVKIKSLLLALTCPKCRQIFRSKYNVEERCKNFALETLSLGEHGHFYRRRKSIDFVQAEHINSTVCHRFNWHSRNRISALRPDRYNYAWWNNVKRHCVVSKFLQKTFAMQTKRVH